MSTGGFEQAEWSPCTVHMIFEVGLCKMVTISDFYCKETDFCYSSAADGIVASTNTNSNLNEELDNLMDISIEIASNKRMKKDNIKPFRLTFKDKELEKKVG